MYSSAKSASEPISKHRPSFLSRFVSQNRAPPVVVVVEKQVIHTPYIPTHAAPSFLSSTTPITIEERYNTKKSKDPVSTMTITERSNAMREVGRKRGEIRVEIITY